MRPYNKPINDENIRVNNKTESSSAHARGALKDLTQISENRKTVKPSKQKIQITKLSSSERFDKKQKLSKEANKKVQNYLINSDDLLIKNHFERISGSNLPLDDADIDIDVDDDNQDEYEPHRLSDNRLLSNIKEVEQIGNISFESSEDEAYRFQPGHIDSDELDNVVERRRQLAQKQKEQEQEQHELEAEDEPERAQTPSRHQQASTQRASADRFEPLEPKWNAAIFRELHYNLNKYSRTTLDVNDEDTYDVTMVAEYAPEIFNYMHELETRLAPDPYYMNNQDELKWEMRSVLIDWVVQVHSRFNLLPETLFLTVNYIDRFLSKRKVSLSRFQLVGAVALFIAAKYEEINCPTVQEVAYMADNAYSIDDFLKAERFMIDVLQFDMGWPGPMSFLRRTSKADDYDYETRTLAKYFLEITIMDARLVAAQPSWLAAGAHYLSRKLLNKGPWTELHVFYSGYTEAQLKPLAEVLLTNCRNAEANHKAIFEKYQERRYKRSSTFVQEYFEAVENS